MFILVDHRPPAQLVPARTIQVMLNIDRQRLNYRQDTQIKGSAS
jgi:hypothetical protein